MKALADISHVYKDCRYGLIENIRFLYGLMRYLASRGYGVLAVGKAYDDDLYAWVYGKKIKDTEYKGLGVAIFKAPKSVEEFEKFNYYMERVDEEVIREALKETSRIVEEG